MGASKRGVSEYLGGGLGVFFFHMEYLAEGGYNYYGYMHRSGNSLIMRETISTGEVKYADGGDKLSYLATRASLDYTNIFSV